MSIALSVVGRADTSVTAASNASSIGMRRLQSTSIEEQDTHTLSVATSWFPGWPMLHIARVGREGEVMSP